MGRETCSKCKKLFKDGSQVSVQCGNCVTWTHKKCLNSEEIEILRTQKYLCAMCSRDDQNEVRILLGNYNAVTLSDEEEEEKEFEDAIEDILNSSFKIHDIFEKILRMEEEMKNLHEKIKQLQNNTCSCKSNLTLETCGDKVNKAENPETDKKRDIEKTSLIKKLFL